MATYGKRFEQQVNRGKELANLLGLKPKKDGYFHTARGKKTTAGLYLLVREFLKQQTKRLKGKMMKTNEIKDLCKNHRRTYYFDDGEGLIGVHNHRHIVLWYRCNMAGYTLVGETATPEGAQKRYL